VIISKRCLERFKHNLLVEKDLTRYWSN